MRSDHARWPESNRFESSALEPPNIPVNEMRGKNAARAAPMSALRARRPMLGRLNVRPMRQQLGGRTRCDVLHQQHVLAGVSGQIVTDIAHTNQQAQGVACPAKLAVNAFQSAFGLFGQATRLPVVECVATPDARRWAISFSEASRVRLCRQRVALLRAVARQVSPMTSPTRLTCRTGGAFRRQILFERRL